MVSHHGINQRWEPKNRTPVRKQFKEYWDRVLRKTARVIQCMTVPELVRLVSDDIFAVKTGCGYLEKNENTMDLHVSQLIRIIVEEKLHDYLKCEERIMRESAKVERKLDQLIKIKLANKSILPGHSSRAETRVQPAASNRRKYVKNNSRCCIM